MTPATSPKGETMHRRSHLFGLFLLLSTLGSGACAGDTRPGLKDVTSNVRIDSLPSHAQVVLSGTLIGATPVNIPVDSKQIYELSLNATGFAPRTYGGNGEWLLNQGLIMAVLVPNGYSGQPPRYDDAKGLLLVAEELQRRSDWGHAAEFWQRILVLQPQNARAHRGLGSAYAKLGRDEDAVREYTQYLLFDPDAPDAERVRRAIDKYRGGIEVRTPGAE
jgi:tetratricopeptide (TPR) repeat protein